MAQQDQRLVLMRFIQFGIGPLQDKGIQSLRSENGDNGPAGEFQQAEESLDQDRYQIGQVSQGIGACQGRASYDAASIKRAVMADL
ncbi:MAG TPA: hypothetical protein VFQ52_02990 [Rhizomicrobium sp.]|nr:hypothetical protein [Rhizomicrobium sp.]